MRNAESLVSLLLALCLAVLAVPVTSYCGSLEPLNPVPVPASNPQTPEKIELGKKLFFDRRLSGDGTMSCATCHNPELAFTDGQEISLSYPTTRNWRNAPGLMNVAFLKNLFYDGRAGSLEEQALFPVMSAFEMNKNLDYLEEQIRQVPEYADSFRKVFSGEATRERIAMAIAAFERTLVSAGTPLDRYLAGDGNALSEKAKKGMTIFTGKGRCADCHYGVSLSDDKFYALSVPENAALVNDPRVVTTARFVAKVYRYEDYRNLNEDPGRYLISKEKKDWKAFRTPPLREVSKTAPYMHNGVFATLDEVIDFFDRGGGGGNTVLRPIGLSPNEKMELKAFLVEALSGEDIRMTFPQVP
jgi:cytochrome c peroxidase